MAYKNGFLMRLTEEDFNLSLLKIATNDPWALVVNFAFDGLEIEHMQRLVNAFETNTVCHTLELSVNNLDQAACSCIAQILRQNQTITSISLTGNDLSNTAVCEIFNALEFNNSLEVLDLLDNKLDDQLLPDLHNLLQKNTKLHYINFAFNKFSLEGISQLLAMQNATLMISVDTRGLGYGGFERNIRLRVKKFLRAKIINNSQSTEHEQANLLEMFQRRIFSAFQQQLDIQEFVYYCLQGQHLCTQLVSEVLQAPHEEGRDQLLAVIGSTLFIAHERGSMEDLIAKIYSYVCFASMQQRSADDEKLMLAAYNCMLGAIGIDPQKSLADWKQVFKLQAKPLPYYETTINKLNSAIDIYRANLMKAQQPTTISKEQNNMLLQLNLYRNKQTMHRELLNANTKLRQPSV